MPPASSRTMPISSHARPGSRISARNRSSSPSTISSTRHQSTASPSWRSYGLRRPRRSPGPPESRSIRPRTVHAVDHEYHPASPPIPSTTLHNTSGGASTCRSRSSTYSVACAQSGSLGMGSLDAPTTLAFDQCVATSASRMRTRARRTASSKPISPSGGSGTQRTMSCSRHTTVLRRLSTSGRASPPGTGVTRPTQRLESVATAPGHAASAGGGVRRPRRTAASCRRR